MNFLYYFTIKQGEFLMFNTKKFGGYLSCLRKGADMTQSELGERLNLTRQAMKMLQRTA